jgi:nucleoside-diphosphate-sugar epimerase
MRILVTGASGFIGAALCRFLLGRGHGVRAAVRRAGTAQDRLAGTDLIEVQDIAADFDRRALLDGIDVVVHLAAIAHRAGVADAELRRVNVDAAVRLAEAASRSARRFVFASSVKAHGETSGERALTEDDPLRPEDAYGRSKRDAEIALGDVAARTGMELVVLRPPLVYGPGVKANFLRLLGWIDRGLPLPLGAVRNRRSLVYAGNLGDAIARSIEHPDARGPFLVADAEAPSAPELVRRIANALGRPARLFGVPPALLRAARLRSLTESLVVDASRARAVLGWRPSFTLDEGLAETARWYRSARR